MVLVGLGKFVVCLTEGEADGGIIGLAVIVGLDNDGEILGWGDGAGVGKGKVGGIVVGDDVGKDFVIVGLDVVKTVGLEEGGKSLGLGDGAGVGKGNVGCGVGEVVASSRILNIYNPCRASETIIFPDGKSPYKFHAP
mmetsp:Transcript_34925/g.38630  ORF Transcript_34925/g.38630 Transcript_34925/m.38630 type:complete len:138 (-) Transcript_34925:530-943(-)